ncbi:MAG: carbonic anhydrase family protein [Deltaproteobacteria bacterium]|nr:carbonic anhydrase family protein [Deltaproteobacteria bacterium]
MTWRSFTLICCASTIVVACSTGGPPWTYSGEQGPTKWGRIDPSYAACETGKSQSPVNIVEVLPRDLPNLAFRYGNAPLHLNNNGRTVEQVFDAGHSVGLGNMQYQLQSLQLHNPSEHRAAGKAFPMELQLLHKSAQGHLLIIAVMIKEGHASAAVNALMNHVPAEAGDMYVSDQAISLMQLLPQQRTYMRYSGSLTSPPCWENVMWVVLTEPIEASKEQIAAFARVLPNNVRPLAPLGRRTVFMDATP